MGAGSTPTTRGRSVPVACENIVAGSARRAVRPRANGEKDAVGGVQSPTLWPAHMGVGASGDHLRRDGGCGGGRSSGCVTLVVAGGGKARAPDEPYRLGRPAGCSRLRAKRARARGR